MTDKPNAPAEQNTSARSNVETTLEEVKTSSAFRLSSYLRNPMAMCMVGFVVLSFVTSWLSDNEVAIAIYRVGTLIAVGCTFLIVELSDRGKR